ncbi:hypothetical protein NQ317_008588 [Molorchus minor]|uniref:EGF-like domain-containing protein n=1 Tax=Molorchus minor TaxID=1323400 RepID=A0ABQ9IT01_9CUCU|nr:hypothetical protein NQ317_008588 [Molorchus minor]
MDAWLQLNGGKHVQGRSKGLFSRITFREPLFIGGPGNISGLIEKLPVSKGLKVGIFIIDKRKECTADRCSRVPCQHGGKCFTSNDSAFCLCPLGFSGDLCEIRVDLQLLATIWDLQILDLYTCGGQFNAKTVPLASDYSQFSSVPYSLIQ